MATPVPPPAPTPEERKKIDSLINNYIKEARNSYISSGSNNMNNNRLVALMNYTDELKALSGYFKESARLIDKYSAGLNLQKEVLKTMKVKSLDSNLNP